MMLNVLKLLELKSHSFLHRLISLKEKIDKYCHPIIALFQALTVHCEIRMDG